MSLFLSVSLQEHQVSCICRREASSQHPQWPLASGKCGHLHALDPRVNDCFPSIIGWFLCDLRFSSRVFFVSVSFQEHQGASICHKHRSIKPTSSMATGKCGHLHALDPHLQRVSSFSLSNFHTMSGSIQTPYFHLLS